MTHFLNLLLPLLILGGLASTFAETPPKQPNIVLIMADDLGYECISANGSTSYKSPNIDRIAGQGVRFENAFANPLCTPSRVKIMTGLYNVRNYVRFGLLPRDETTFAHQVKKAGYTTCIAGKWQLGNEADSPSHFGFDKSCLWQHTLKGNKRKLDQDEIDAIGGKAKTADNRFSNPDMTIDGEVKHFRDGEFGPTICTDYICDFIEDNKDKPFCVYYPMILTHCPFIATPDSADWDPKFPGSPTYKGDAKYFGDMVTTMDKLVGRIDAKLTELGLSENTLFIFTGDNGTDVPVVSKMGEQVVKAGKGKVEDTGTRVPFVVKWPGKIQTGAVSKDLVDFADLMPTICEITGAPLPKAYPGDGKSLMPELTGSGLRGKDWVYFWYRGKTWARNRHYGLRITQGADKEEFFKYADQPFVQQELATAALEGEAKAAYDNLAAVVADMAKTRRVKNAEPKQKKPKLKKELKTKKEPKPKTKNQTKDQTKDQTKEKAPTR